MTPLQTPVVGDPPPLPADPPPFEMPPPPPMPAMPQPPPPDPSPPPLNSDRVSEVTNSEEVMSRKEKILQKIMQGKQLVKGFLNEAIQAAKQVNLLNVAFGAMGIAGAVVLTAAMIALFAMVPAAIGPTVIIGLATFIPAVTLSAAITHFVLPRSEAVDPKLAAQRNEAIQKTNQLQERASELIKNSSAVSNEGLAPLLNDITALYNESKAYRESLEEQQVQLPNGILKERITKQILEKLDRTRQMVSARAQAAAAARAAAAGPEPDHQDEDQGRAPDLGPDLAAQQNGGQPDDRPEEGQAPN